ncbi:cell division protein FtsQ/DivIB [Olsenella sp. HMSC062G07]|uniref:cell division protein FtsQ/DivIB n=1 Tax=Olsenella sp. HMSC062G07 TaxID=1739330 RepID=UPI0008A632AE|nr:FtsQ-type POTRA domain-containing protein [Olsenella sp. HMSC062G07]OFK24875.1 hypothetical protein HMPREF2826_06590 [Olsenella sp. HMSC062G07]
MARQRGTRRPTGREGRFTLGDLRRRTSPRRPHPQGARPTPSKRTIAPDRRTSSAERDHRQIPIRRAIVICIALATMALLGLFALLALSYTPAFTITGVEADASAHMDAATIVRLANVDAHSTLLNLDEAAVTERLRKNPWVDGVSYTRVFPDRLRITVRERDVAAIVVMGTGDIAWLLGKGGIWIEPCPLEVGPGQTINEVALAKASELGVLLLTGAPGTVSPVAGHESTDDVIEAVRSYQENFSDELRSQIVSYSIPSVDSIACVLSSGVVVSLGPAANVDAKQSAILRILDEHQHRLTYINVRNASSPGYRALESDDVQAGSGAVGDGAPSGPAAGQDAQPADTGQEAAGT